jgi:DNA (cytosine-5)-methyltransferase 1
MSVIDFNVLDLFCGAGGMTEGFLQAGFRVPNSCDYSKEAAETYKNRQVQLGYKGHAFLTGDIRELTRRKKLKEFLAGKEIHVITGGPPCQGFSITGKRADDDVRNYLFLEFLKIIKMVKPLYFVMENVEGILSYKFNKITGLSGELYENEFVPNIIIKEARKFGYDVKYRLLNARDYGVPQNRPRVIFIGYKIKKYRKKIIPLVEVPDFPIKHNKIVTVYEAISDLSFLKNGNRATEYNEMYIPSQYQKQLRNGLTPNRNGLPVKAEALTNHLASKHSGNAQKRFDLLKPGESIADLLERLDPLLKKELDTKKYRCRKLHVNDVSPTVLTLPDDIIHYEKGNSRILTVRELARIQSFDDSFEFLGKRTTGGERRKYETPQYTQVGNAVPPLFAKAIAECIIKALVKTYRKEGERIE